MNCFITSGTEREKWRKRRKSFENHLQTEKSWEETEEENICLVNS